MSALVEGRSLSLAGRLEPTSIALGGGELTCLIGPNGSGKTSLLHALAGIGSPGGDVFIEGVNPRGVPPERRRRLLSYLPASRDIHWPVTGADLIGLGGADPRAVAAIAADLELGDLLGRRMDRLSTGERSRILIARALAGEPRLVLLDEPIANLDPAWQLRLLQRLTERCRANQQGVLMAVHDLEIARRYADRLIVMNNGRVVADGEPGTLFQSSVIPQVFEIERVGDRWVPVA